MKVIFPSLCFVWLVSFPVLCMGTRIIGIELKLLEMTAEQSLELNLGMTATLVGRKETGEPIYEQSLGETFWEKFRSMEGVESVDVPRLTVQVGRRGVVQVGKEFNYPVSRDKATGRIQIGQKFLGYEILAVPQAGEGDIAVDMAVQVVLREMQDAGELGKDTLRLPRFLEFRLRARPVLIPGKSICFGELEKGDGTRVMVIGRILE